MRHSADIPLHWGNGLIGSVRDDGGILHMRRVNDEELKRQELEFQKGLAKLPTGLLPTHPSPSISAPEAKALLEELEWLSK